MSSVSRGKQVDLYARRFSPLSGRQGALVAYVTCFPEERPGDAIAVARKIAKEQRA